jgi:hypothetical protein
MESIDSSLKESPDQAQIKVESFTLRKKLFSLKKNSSGAAFGYFMT